MNNKTKTIALALSAAMGTMVTTGSQAQENPFELSKLTGGYTLAKGDQPKEGKCGEGKCGAGKKKEGKCGEGKCGADKKKEGKCGEGKCGANK